MKHLSALFEGTGPVEFFGDAAGLHMMIRLPLQKIAMTNQQFVQLAQQHGVDLFCVDRYYLPQEKNELTDDNGLFIFGFGGMDEVAIEAAIARLKTIVTHDLSR